MTARRRFPPSGYLMRRIPQVAADPAWGGGLHRADLAAALHVREHDKTFIASLFACRARGLVDLWKGYVISTPKEEP